MLKNNRHKGDTLIEVLFATATFSLLAVGGLSIMNKGVLASQRALEITLVRNAIDSQAETLRFLNSSYIAAYNLSDTYEDGTPAKQWSTMVVDIDSTGVSAFSSNTKTCPTPPEGSFILNPKTATFVSPSSGFIDEASTFSKLVFDESDQLTSAQGIWIEAVKSTTSVDPSQINAGYIDFHIRACWYSSGQTIPVTLGTIVRLYEPRQ